MKECRYSNLTMKSSDGAGLSQLYLELVDAYKKRFVPQNGQATVLKCSPIWKKMREFLKQYLSLKFTLIPKYKLGNGKLRLHQLEKEPHFPYRKELK